MDGGAATAVTKPLPSDRAANPEEDVANLGSRDDGGPPDDDCCPICFGDYTVPCKTSCGHWFCASCILMFWNYSRCLLRRCKCPICTRLINKFIPKASLLLQQDNEVIKKTLKDVWNYNNRFGGGVRGLFMKGQGLVLVIRKFAEGLPSVITRVDEDLPLVIRTFAEELPSVIRRFAEELPSVIRRFAEGLPDPNRATYNIIAIRMVSMFLGILYDCCGFDFIPTGNRNIVSLFDSVALFLAASVYLVIDFRHRRRARPAAENHQD